MPSIFEPFMDMGPARKRYRDVDDLVEQEVSRVFDGFRAATEEEVASVKRMKRAEIMEEIVQQLENETDAAEAEAERLRARLGEADRRCTEHVLALEMQKRTVCDVFSNIPARALASYVEASDRPECTSAVVAAMQAREGDELVQATGCSALGVAMRRSADDAARVLEAGGFEAVAKALHMHAGSREVVSRALFSMECAHACARVTHEHVRHVLTAIDTFSDDEYVWQMGWRVIARSAARDASLVRGIDGMADRVHAALSDDLDPCVRALFVVIAWACALEIEHAVTGVDSTEAFASSSAMWVLSTACSQSRELAQRATKLGAAAAIVRAMKKHPQNVILQCRACSALTDMIPYMSEAELSTSGVERAAINLSITLVKV